MSKPSPSRCGVFDDVVIGETVRTPIGRYGGMFKDVTAVDLGVRAVVGLLERTGVQPEQVNDIVLGHCNYSSDAPAIGRVIALDAGLPLSVTGMHLDRRCGSGLQAIIQGAVFAGSGLADVVVAGGVESMSNASFYTHDIRWGARGPVALNDGLAKARQTAGGRHHSLKNGMLETAENLRREFSISREEQDRLGVMSHKRAVAAQESGVLAEEIVAVEVAGSQGQNAFGKDEHPRPGTTLESLGRLKPILLASDAESTVTAGNSSGQNDAAAVTLVANRQQAENLGIQPWLRPISWAVAGVEPARMGIGPVPATQLALERAGLTMQDLDVLEVNEAFAAQVLAVYRSWGFGESDLDRVNVHGSGISLGHPVGATGARMVGALSRELRRRQGRFGLVTMCIGGGQGMAAIFESMTT